MVSARRTLLLCMFGALAHAFLDPARPFHHFAADDKQQGERRFMHSEHHLLPNYTTVELRWEAHLDPASILMLDTEHQNGVRLAACAPNQLVLHLPASYVPLARAWKHVTASDHLHGCAHLKDHPLYHRIKDIEFTKHHETPKGGTTAVLTTTELQSPGDVIPRLSFSYIATPIDSLHPDEQDAARKDYEERVEAMLEGEGRRLQYGEFKQSNHTLQGYNNINIVPGGTDDRTWRPLSHAHFGWNWNYRTRTVRNPQFKVVLPALKGFILLKNPYLKVLGGLTVQYQSKWDEVNPFQTPPHVNIVAQLKGNAAINLDLSFMGVANKDVSNDPFGTKEFEIPGMGGPNNWFNGDIHKSDKIAVHFPIGGIPIHFIPGFSCPVRLFHNGLFQGSLRGGVNTKARVDVVASFDSVTGLNMQANIEALDTRILTPTWMIFTKHFEIGAFLSPTLWLIGGIGSQSGRLAFTLTPKLSASVLAEGERAYGLQQQIRTKRLIIYPFRAIGLPPGQTWSVGIKANQQSKMTSTRLATGPGIIEYDDYVDHFQFGLIDQQALQHNPFYVVLFRNGQWQAGTTVAITCREVVDGVCAGDPQKANFEIEGRQVVVELTVAWHNDPKRFLENHIRCIGIKFPRVTLTAEASKEYTTMNPSKVEVRIQKAGRTYSALATPDTTGSVVALATNKIQCMGIAWVDAWRVRYGSIIGEDRLTEYLQPQVELVYYTAANPTGIVQARGAFNHLDFSTVDDRNFIADRFRFYKGATYVKDTAGLPIYGEGEYGFGVWHPIKCPRFLYPGWPQKVGVGHDRTVYWSTQDGLLNKHMQQQSFTATVLRLGINGAYAPDPLAGAPQAMPMNCEPGPLQLPGITDYGDTCHFKWNIPAGAWVKSAKLKMMLTWTDQHGHNYEMVSPELDIQAQVTTPQATLRRLDAAVDAEIDRSGRELQQQFYGIKKIDSSGSQVDVKRNGQLHPICIKKKLKYNLHVGVDYRIHLEDVDLARGTNPGSLPMEIMAALGKNLMDTGNQPVYPIPPVRMFLDKILPPGMCKGGLCNGELPGCPGQISHAKFLGNLKYAKSFVYPPVPNQTLALQLSRPFEWTKSSNARASAAIAFATSLLPEFIRIASLAITQVFGNGKPNQNHQPGEIWEHGNALWINGKRCLWRARPVCAAEFIYQGRAYQGCTMRSHNYRGWCSLDRTFAGNWRNCLLFCEGIKVPADTTDKTVKKLREQNAGGRRLTSESDETVVADRFLVSFEPGSLNYGLTDDFVRTLIRRQAFRGMADQHGEVNITGFRVLNGGTPDIHTVEMLPAPTDVEMIEAKFTKHDVPEDPSTFEFHRSIAQLKRDGIEVPSFYTVYGRSLLTVAVGSVAVLAASLAIGCYVWKQRAKTPYLEVGAQEEVIME